MWPATTRKKTTAKFTVQEWPLEYMLLLFLPVPIISTYTYTAVWKFNYIIIVLPSRQWSERGNSTLGSIDRFDCHQREREVSRWQRASADSMSANCGRRFDAALCIWRQRGINSLDSADFRLLICIEIDSPVLVTVHTGSCCSDIKPVIIFGYGQPSWGTFQSISQLGSSRTSLHCAHNV